MRVVVALVGGLFALVGLAVFLWISPGTQEAPAQGVPSADAAQAVDIGGLHLEAVIKGRGTPAVVFDAGFIGGMARWAPAQDAVSNYTLTLRYERAGLGGSDVGPEPRTARQIALELHALLASARVESPVVLVGHSAGGAFARMFTSMYPDEVAGLVLVDPGTEAAWNHWRMTDSEDWDGFETEVAEMPPPDGWQRPWPPPGWIGQWQALPESIEQLRAAWPLPAVPTVLLTALVPFPGEWMLEDHDRIAIWRAAHEALVARTPNAEHIALAEADHLTILNEPILAAKILEVVVQVRSSR